MSVSRDIMSEKTLQRLADLDSDFAEGDAALRWTIIVLATREIARLRKRELLGCYDSMLGSDYRRSIEAAKMPDDYYEILGEV